MAYGFNDDKSKFDVSGIGKKTLAFTPMESANVYDIDVNVYAYGPTAYVDGTFTANNTTAGTWYPIGTIDGPAPVAETYGTCARWDGRALVTSSSTGAEVKGWLSAITIEDNVIWVKVAALTTATRFATNFAYRLANVDA